MTKPLQQTEVLARITTHLRLHQVAQQLRQEHRQVEVGSKVERERLFAAVRQQRSQLRALTNKLTEVQENERRTLARELHDELGQALTAIRMDLAAVEKDLPGTASRTLRERLGDAARLTEQTLEQVRELSLDLRPPMLDDLGLVPTLRWYLKRYQGRTEIRAGLQVMAQARSTAQRLLYADERTWQSLCRCPPLSPFIPKSVISLPLISTKPSVMNAPPLRHCNRPRSPSIQSWQGWDIESNQCRHGKITYHKLYCRRNYSALTPGTPLGTSPTCGRGEAI